MINKELLIWIQNGDVVKGELDFNKGIVIFYDKFGNILMRRTNFTHKQMIEIRKQIQKQLTTREHIGYYYV